MTGQSRRPGDDEDQTEGRKANAAQPVQASGNDKGAERYPSVRPDDAVEPAPGEARSFDRNPTPRQGAGDDNPASTSDGRLGAGGEPAEGKR
jgi:hypothetical protein